MAAGMAALFLGAAALGGCAGAKVSGVTVNGPPAHQPALLLVAVNTPGDAEDAAAMRSLAGSVQSDLLERLSKARIPATILGTAPVPPGDAVLRVDIVRADPGNDVKRLLVGFGAGRAKLEVRAGLYRPDQSARGPALAFSSHADSGRNPGLILPGGVALATQNAVHFAIGGAINLASNARGGLKGDVRHTADAIVHQLQAYYYNAGWLPA